MAKDKKKKIPITVCNGSKCADNKSAKIARLLEAQLEEEGVDDRLTVKKCECVGKCKKCPVVLFPAADLTFEGVKPKETAKVLKKILDML